ncbi:MAG: two-component system sensor histidine kinase NtrB [Pseudobdellovibrionaceae bacterium]
MTLLQRFNIFSDRFVISFDFVQGLRLIFYLLVFIVLLFKSFLAQPFILADFIIHSLLATLVILVAHTVLSFFITRNKIPQSCSFVLDALGGSWIVLNFISGSAAFIFFSCLCIVGSGLIHGAFLTIALALIFSLSLSLYAVFAGPLVEINAYQIFAMNFAFFMTAWIAIYFVDQIQKLTTKLQKEKINLQDLQQIFASMLTSMPVGVVSFKNNGDILHMNPAAESIFFRNKKTEDNIFSMWQEVKDTFSKDFVGVLKFTSSLSSEPQILQVKVKHVYSPVVEADIAVGVFEDQTEILKIQDRLKQSEKLAAVGALAAGIAHEIRNPLASISGSIEMLSQNSNTPEDRKLMQIVLKEIGRLNNLISEFLDFAKPDKGPSDRVNLYSIIKEVLEQCQLSLEKPSNIHIETQTGLTEAWILGASDKLKQVFLNIVINSFQATKSVQQAVLSVQLHKENDFYKVAFKDNGCGMSPEQAKRIFEPFFTTKSKGTGLGMAITYKILQSHQAQIFVESQPGLGTEIQILFPIYPKNT